MKGTANSWQRETADHRKGDAIISSHIHEIRKKRMDEASGQHLRRSGVEWKRNKHRLEIDIACVPIPRVLYFPRLHDKGTEVDTQQVARNIEPFFRHFFFPSEHGALTVYSKKRWN